ncbi:MAG: cytochrome P460 family protein [Flavipsychrobacter sp.]
MKKTVFTFSVLSLLALSVAMQSCKNDNNPTPATPTVNEFIADNTTFKGFESWYLHITKNGADPSGLGNAHGGADNTSERKIYFTSNSVNRVNGQFPVGTIISKRTTGANGLDMITAMAKRGNDFDASGNNWEYFVLAADGTIMMDNGTAMRGSNLMNGACKSCHAKASTNDYVFTK